MANTPATGNGPFEFTNDKGQHISIPISAFGFDVNNKIVVHHDWEPFTQAQPGRSFLDYALSEKIIAPAPVPSPFPAMVIRAADPGAGGNNISVSVTVSKAVTSPPNDDPTQVYFSLKVKEVDVYPGLTAATIESVLSAQPGLVQAVNPDPQGIPNPTSGTLVGSPAQLDVDGSGSPALVFTLVAKKSGLDGASTHVSVTPDGGSPPSPGSQTFTLVATWEKEVSGITLTTLAALIASELSYEITVSRPGSGAYSLPAPGTSPLSGGGTGVNASATLFTGP